MCMCEQGEEECWHGSVDVIARFQGKSALRSSLATL